MKSTYRIFLSRYLELSQILTISSICKNHSLLTCLESRCDNSFIEKKSSDITQGSISKITINFVGQKCMTGLVKFIWRGINYQKETEDSMKCVSFSCVHHFVQ